MKLFYLIIFSSFISYLSCNFSPGSYPNAELYELDTKESNLIEAIKDFKNEYPMYALPQDLFLVEGKESENDYWYHIYFYYNDEETIISTWIRPNFEGKVNFAFVSLYRVSNQEGWKDINKDFGYFENKIEKKKFEERILNPILEILK
jgi:hypothetical protein